MAYWKGAKNSMKIIMRIFARASISNTWDISILNYKQHAFQFNRNMYDEVYLRINSSYDILRGYINRQLYNISYEL